MRIVKLSSLSEQERKRVLEEQEERYNKGLEESQRLQREANQKFNEYVAKNGAYDTNKHTTNYKNILDAMDNKEQKKAFKKNNNISLWDQIKDYGSFWRDSNSYVTRKTGVGLLGGLGGMAQSVTTETANQLKKGQEKKLGDISKDLVSTLINYNNGLMPYGFSQFKTTTNTINRIKESFTDNDKTFLEKITGIALDTNAEAIENTSIKRLLNNGIQLTSKILPENSYKEVLKMNQKISEPIEKMSQDLEEEGSKYNDLVRFVGNTGQSIGGMLPSIATTAVTKNPNAGLAVMGLSVKGQATQEALNKGEDIETAVKIGDAKMLIETFTEKISGGAKIFGKGSLDDIAEDLIKNKAKSTFGKFLLKQIYNTGGEITEEQLSNVLNNIIDKGTTDPEKKIWDWNEFLNTFLQTGVSTNILNAFGGYKQDYNIAKQQTLQQNQFNKNINQEQTGTNQISDNKILEQEAKTESNGISQIENQNQAKINEQEQKIQQLKDNTQNNLSKLKQYFPEEMYNEMQHFIETAPSEQALNQVNEDLKIEAKNQLNETYKSERFTESQERKKTYAKYQREYNINGIEYNNEVVNNALDMIVANRNGKRTVGQWKQVAKQIGIQASDLSKADIDNIAYGSWFDLQPNKNITQYDNRTKQHKGFEKFTSDDWINTIYETAKEQKIQGIDNELNKNISKQNIGQFNKYLKEQNKNGIKPYNENDIQLYTKSNNNLIDGYNGNLKDFINEHYDSMSKSAKQHNPRGKEKTMFLGRISDSISSKLNSLLKMSKNFNVGYDLNDNNFIVKENNIEHTFKEHGNETKPGQIDVTPENFSKIADVLGNPDYLGLSDNATDGNPTFYFAKKINGYSVAVEVAKKNKQLYPKSYFVFDSQAKEWNEFIINHKLKEANSMHSNELQNNSSEINVQNDIVEASSINNSIPQNNKTVKENTITNNIMQDTQENIQKTQQNQEVKAPMKNTQQTRVNFDNEVLKTNSEIRGNSDTSEKIAKILSEPSKRTKPEQRTWAILKANFIDKGAVFEKISQKTKNRELQGKYDYTLTSGARGQYAIGNDRYVYSNGKKTLQAKALTSIIDEVGENTQAFNEYMYHQLNVDRMTLNERFGIDNKPVFGESVTADDSRAEIAKIEEQHPEFKEYANDVYKYLEANKQELVDRGVISQETSDFFKERYPHYVPIQRATRKGNSIDVPLDTGRTGINSPIKKAKGGNQDINPLFQTMANQTLQTYRASARNNFGLELMNTLQQMNQLNESKTIADIDDIVDTMTNEEQNNELLQPSKKGENPTFTVFEDGKKITYDISQDMYDALKPKSEILNKLDNTKIAKAGKTISNFRRGVLTEYNPVFSITNAIKDAQDVLINSQHAGKTYAKFPEAYAQILKKGYWYNEYLQNGGEQNSYFTEGDFENIKKSRLAKAKNILTFPLEKISQVNNAIEIAPRLAEYIVSRENGASIETSMLDASRVTTNFKAGGDITKSLNRNGFTFLNASVQGFQQQVRNIQEANAKGLKGWTVLAIKYAIAGLPTLLLNNLFWNDDDDYEQLQDYVKDNYYVIAKLPNGNFLRIPKGRMTATIQKIVSNVNDFVRDGKINSNNVASTVWNDLKEDIQFGLNNLAPNNPIENNILSPIFQVANNKTWYGENLVPQRLQDVPVEEQSDETTDKLSKWLGEKLKVSPIKINYLLDQYLGGIGDVLLPLGTPQAENNVIEDKFTTDPIMKSQYPSDFFTKVDELNIKNNSVKATDEDKLKYKYISSVQQEISNLYKQKREIQASEKSDDEKKKELKEIQKQINGLAKESLENIDKVEISGNGATIGGKEFYKKDGTWTKLTEKEKEKLKDTSVSIYSSYKQSVSDLRQKKISSGELEEGKDLSDKDKIQLLRDSGYSKEDKANLYEKTITNDAYYSTLKKSGIDIDEYMDYKIAQSNGKFTADKKNGKTVMRKRKRKSDRLFK